MKSFFVPEEIYFLKLHLFSQRTDTRPHPFGIYILRKPKGVAGI